MPQHVVEVAVLQIQESAHSGVAQLVAQGNVAQEFLSSSVGLLGGLRGLGDVRVKVDLLGIFPFQLELFFRNVLFLGALRTAKRQRLLLRFPADGAVELGMVLLEVWVAVVVLIAILDLVEAIHVELGKMGSTCLTKEGMLAWR